MRHPVYRPKVVPLGSPKSSTGSPEVQIGCPKIHSRCILGEPKSMVPPRAKWFPLGSPMGSPWFPQKHGGSPTCQMVPPAFMNNLCFGVTKGISWQDYEVRFTGRGMSEFLGEPIYIYIFTISNFKLKYIIFIFCILSNAWKKTRLHIKHPTNTENA